MQETILSHLKTSLKKVQKRSASEFDINAVISSNVKENR